MKNPHDGNMGILRGKCFEFCLLGKYYFCEFILLFSLFFILFKLIFIFIYSTFSKISRFQTNPLMSVWIAHLCVCISLFLPFFFFLAVVVD